MRVAPHAVMHAVNDDDDEEDEGHDKVPRLAIPSSEGNRRLVSVLIGSGDLCFCVYARPTLSLAEKLSSRGRIALKAYGITVVGLLVLCIIVGLVANANIVGDIGGDDSSNYIGDIMMDAWVVMLLLTLAGIVHVAMERIYAPLNNFVWVVLVLIFATEMYTLVSTEHRSRLGPGAWP